MIMKLLIISQGFGSSETHTGRNIPKSFIGDTLNKSATERLYGSIAATAIAVRNGRI